MIDMHCHLDLYSDPNYVVQMCREKRIYVLSVTTTPSAWQGTQSLAKDCPRIRTALGLHPQIAHERYSELPLFDELLPLNKYIGEVGLEGSPGWEQHYKTQKNVFLHILKSVDKQGGRILTIHSRKAVDEVLGCLKMFPGVGNSILHWFTGSQAQLKKAIEQGCWFSVGPAMLSTKKGTELARRMPRRKVLPETDGPFAKLNRASLMPWQASLAVEQISVLWGMAIEDTKAQLLSNLKDLTSNFRTGSGSTLCEDWPGNR